ncbi:MAG: TRAP transporter small permease [Rhodospirillaceae bacterium]
MTDAVSAVARFVSRVAAVFLLGMVAINVVDVGLRSGLNAPLFGTYEVVELLLAAVAFLAIPEAFLRGQHIAIELIDQVVSPRVVDGLRVFGTVCVLCFLGLLTWHMVQPALDAIQFNEVTMDLRIPLIWKAALILAGIGLSCIAVVVILARDLSTLFNGGRDR